MAYSLDFRTRAVGLLKEGMSAKEVSSLLSVGTATLFRWKRRHKEERLAACYPQTRVNGGVIFHHYPE